jgi:hypothetical protein
MTDYTVDNFTADFMKVVNKAKKAGVDTVKIVEVTMGLAHAMWDDCYEVDGNNEGLQKIKAQHPSWADLGQTLKDAGFLTPEEVTMFNAGIFGENIN